MDQNVAPHRTIEPQRAAEPRGGAIDLWVRRELKSRYDDALREPLPRNLVELIESS